MGEAGSRLGVVSKSLHLLRGAASFRPLGAMGNDKVNARLSIPDSRDDQAQIGKVRSTPEKITNVSISGQGVLGDGCT